MMCRKTRLLPLVLGVMVGFLVATGASWGSEVADAGDGIEPISGTTPDLVVTALDIWARPPLKQRVPVYVTIANIGSKYAVPSADSVMVSVDFAGKKVSCQLPFPGSGEEVSGRVFLKFLTAQVYTVRAIVDPENEFSETCEDNNELSEKIAVIKSTMPGGCSSCDN